MKILLAEDDDDMRRFLVKALINAGYDVNSFDNRVSAYNRLREEPFELLLTDIVMPEMDGIEACDHIRRLPGLEHTIIAFLTARGEDYSQVAGFEAGADDYITKPVKPKVLMSRIKALLRRRPAPEQEVPGKIEFEDLIIDPERYHVELQGSVIELPRKEFELLSLLASKPGKVFTREEIMDRIWGTVVIVGGRTIDVHIRKLREKIGDDRIKTVKGVGYKFEIED